MSEHVVRVALVVHGHRHAVGEGRPRARGARAVDPQGRPLTGADSASPEALERKQSLVFSAVQKATERGWAEPARPTVTA